MTRARPKNLLAEAELERFARGRHQRVQELLGAHPQRERGVDGLRFAVWAPQAAEVWVAGDFNDWTGTRLTAQSHGVWAAFVPGAAAGTRYKFRLRNAETDEWLDKADPFARGAEVRPGNASVAVGESQHTWGDASWLSTRRERDFLRQPLSIYEVHLGSWRRAAEGAWLRYEDIATPLADYVADLGFTHVELLPITEHPYDGSWGYQASGYFAPTSRFGEADGLRLLIDTLHQRGIGVLLDWSPAHFPRDSFALAQFDGAPLFEHADPHRGEHPDWDSLIFDYGRAEVRSFLISSALYWIEAFHVDGLRVDACASMLYLDYSRGKGEWTPNVHGGKENLEAIHFLQQLNDTVHAQAPGVLMIAEESTAWPGVTRPSWLGGLGFDLKWNMGWMNDTLSYCARPAPTRRYHQAQLTFTQHYAQAEHYLLPLSHDEVVHGKSPLVGKMGAADESERFALLRALYALQWLMPGKKLLFMGGEFAQNNEWDYESALDWPLLSHAPHQGVQRLVRDLNQLYAQAPALHALEHETRGFEWLDTHDHAQSVISWLRCGPQDFLAVVANFSPLTREGYRIALPCAGRYRERLNTDSTFYGGSDRGNGGAVEAEETPWCGRRYSVELTLPAHSVLVLQPEFSSQ